MAVVGYILFGLGGFFTALNFYLCFLRFPLHRAFGGTRESYQWASGIPLLGSLLLWISIPFLPSAPWMWLAAGLSLLDTGGIHWFASTMLWMEVLKPRMYGSTKPSPPLDPQRPAPENEG